MADPRHREKKWEKLLFQVPLGHLCSSFMLACVGEEGPQTQVVLNENQQTQRIEVFCKRDGSIQDISTNLHPKSCVFPF